MTIPRRKFLKGLGLLGTVIGTGVSVKALAEPVPLPLPEPALAPALELKPYNPLVPEEWSRQANETLMSCFPPDTCIVPPDMMNLVRFDYSAALEELLDEGVVCRALAFTDSSLLRIFHPDHLYMAAAIKDSDMATSRDLMTLHIYPMMLAWGEVFNRFDLIPTGSCPPVHGKYQHISDGGRIPIRAAVHYDVSMSAHRLFLETYINP